MSSARNRRIPLNCEPCRIRKIRCSRDGTPCGTCIRRGIPNSQCVYANRKSMSIPTVNQAGNAPISPLSNVQSSSSSGPNEDLADRVRRLEQMLLSQTQANQTSSNAQQGPEGQYCSPESTNALEHSSGDKPMQTQDVGLSQTLGHLNTSEHGHVRYIPHGSQWNSVLNSSTEAGYSLGAHNVDMDGPFPFGQNSKSTKQDFLDRLPPARLCTELKDTYFTSFAPLFHLLHDPTFHQQYRRFENDPTSVSLSWLALLFAILAAAVNALDSNSTTLHDLSRQASVSAKIADLSEKYRTAAMKCLEADNYMWQHNVATLQALIILIYGINHSHGQTWTLLGLAHNLALSIGCHIDPSYFNLDIVECEERRRCWAGLMMLYTVQNTTMGNLGLPQVSSNTRAPADIDDDQLVSGQQELPLANGSASQMSYILLKFRLYNICSDICRHVLNVAQPSPTVITNLDERISAEQAHWENKYLVHTRSTPLPLQHLIHLKILYGYSHQLTLLLHRPAFINRSTTDSSQYERSRQRCLQSARCLLDIHSSISCLTEFGWYIRGLGSFHAFHAAVMLVVILSDCRDMAMFSELRQMLEECEDRFANMADLSPICRKAAPVLRHFLAIIGSAPPSFDGVSRDTVLNVMDTQQAPTHSSGEPAYMSPVQEMSSAIFEDPSNLESLLEQLQPQQWLTPGRMTWDQWDHYMSNASIANIT